jgi:hypothetical protein
MRKLRLALLPAIVAAAELLGTASANGYFRTK